MNRLLVVIWLVVVALVAVVTGCDRAPRYDSRLVAADSLMQPDPDSALALVEAVAPGSLKAEGDSAYRDLLLTQARYRCYITATSDSDINRALDYYRRHDGEREKLTRAFIYKGAVMEELGHPDSAMCYYKQAEASAAPDDYFNLGYANMRMGALYRDHYSHDGKEIEKYELASKYLEHTDDTHYQLVCKINLASLYRLNNPSKAEAMLQDAMDIAHNVNDTTNYLVCLQNLIVMYDYYKNYNEARELIRHLMSFPMDKSSIMSFTTSAKVYANLGMPDSAEYFLKLAEDKNIIKPLDRLSYLEGLAEVALAQGHRIEHLKYTQQCKNLSDSIKSNQETIAILKSEQEFEQTAKNDLNKKHHKSINSLLGLGVLIILALSLFYYYRAHRYDRIIAELQEEAANQSGNELALRRNIEQLKIQDGQLKEFISSHLNLMQDVMNASYQAPRNILSNSIKRIIEFQEDNKDKWVKLYDYVDIQYNHIMTQTRKNYPELKDRDLLLIALTSLDYSCAQIAIICGYSNATSISGNRQRLAKKMGLPSTLKDYIQSFKPSQDNIG